MQLTNGCQFYRRNSPPFGRRTPKPLRGFRARCRQRYMSIATLRFFAMMLVILPSYGEEKGLIGLWKSNEEFTLRSMRSTAGIPEEMRAHLEDNFFGLMYIEYTETGVAAWFEDEEKPIEYEPYSVIDESAAHFLVEHIDELTGEMTKTELIRNSDCYHLSVSKWSFREYFCRVP